MTPIRPTSLSAKRYILNDQTWLVGVAVLAAAVVLVISFLSLTSMQNAVRKELSSLLGTTLGNTVARLQAWENVRRRDLEVWATNAEVIELVGVMASFGSHVPDPIHREANTLLMPALRAWDGMTYSVVNLEGMVMTSSAREEIAAASPITYIPGFMAHILAGQASVSRPLHRVYHDGIDGSGLAVEKQLHPFNPEESGHLAIYVAAPIRSPQGQVVAALVFELDPIADFSTILSSGRGRETMETFAFSEDGLLLSESRYNAQLVEAGLIGHRDHSLLNVHVRDPGGDLSKGYKPKWSPEAMILAPLTEMAAQAVKGRSGLNLDGYRSYMGHEVIGAWAWSEDLGFGVATEMSVEEAYRTYNAARWQVLLASGLASGLMIGLAVIFYTGRRRIGEGARRLEAIMDNVLDGIIVINEKGIIESYNASAARIFGYGPEETLGQNISMLTPEPHRSAHDMYLKKFLETGQSNVLGVGREVTGQRKNGDIFPLDLAVTEMIIHGRRLFLGMTRDITERKQSQEVLSRSEQSLKTTQRIAKLGGWVWQIDAGKVSWSDEVFRIFGYRAQEFEPTYDAFLAAVHHEDRPAVQSAISQALETHKPYGIEYRIVRPDGETAVVYGQGEVDVDAWGDPVRVNGIVHDIDERKEAERLKSEFVSTVSHELRTPLTAIHGSLGLLASGATGALPEQAATLVNVAHKNSDRLIHLIDDILDVEKLEAGRMEFNLGVQSARDLLAAARETNTPYADKFNIRLVFNTPPEGLNVVVDPIRFAQVMANLISNAVKFSPDGGEVKVTAEQTKNYVRFAVADQGAGIPEQFQERIFQHFSQADASDTRQIGGTGLGLSISKAIVEKMGGRIGFLTQEGRGTTFYCEFREAE